MGAADEQCIEQWSIVGRRSLKGNLHQRHGRLNRGGIVTSGVVEIHMVAGQAGEPAYAVAITESGSVYRLGRPAEGPGAEAARLFIAAYLRRGAGRGDDSGTGDTAPPPLHPRHERMRPGADVYATCFKPL